MNSPAFWIGYVVLIFAFMYFIAIKPQQKEKKKSAPCNHGAEIVFKREGGD